MKGQVGESPPVDVAARLQLKADQALFVADRPADVSLELADSSILEQPSNADTLVFFCVDRGAVERRREQVTGAARRDLLVWVAYPKAGRLGTDLSRDSLAALFKDDGVRPGRQIAIDETWSALRFRPGSL
jgi:hypothetical protein